MNNVNITIDGKKLSVPSDYTVLMAAKDAGINIPTLCYLRCWVSYNGCAHKLGRAAAWEEWY